MSGKTTSKAAPKTRPVVDEKVVKALTEAALAAVPCDDMLVEISANHRRHLRFAKNSVTTSGDVETAIAEVTCVVNGKHAHVQAAGLTPALLVDAAKRARAFAELVPSDPEYVPYPGGAAIGTNPATWSDATASVSAQRCADAVAPVLAEAESRKLLAAGFLQLDTTTRAIATKSGLFCVNHGTRAAVSVTARTQDGTGSGWGDAQSESFAALDVARLGRLACDRAERARSPRAFPPGDYTVVLEPAAVEELLGYLVRALDMRASEEGTSAFSAPEGKTRLGEKLLGSLNLWTDPRDKRVPSALFDDVGQPRARLALVDAGVVKALRVSRFWGKKTSRPPTADFDTFIASGVGEPQKELVKGVQRGLLVSRLWYTNLVDPRTLTVTGLTRDGVFLVENGEIVDSVNNFRFNQSVLELFANVDAYGPSERHRSIVPAVRATDFHMSTKSDAV